jgi:hypothetical protein
MQPMRAPAVRIRSRSRFSVPAQLKTYRIDARYLRSFPRRFAQNARHRKMVRPRPAGLPEVLAVGQVYGFPLDPLRDFLESTTS